MFIGHKSNTLIGIGEVEWMCYSECKELYPPDYWTWHESITTVTGDPPDVKTTIDYSGETGYKVVNCTDEDVTARLKQLSDYIDYPIGSKTVYNIKYYASKRNAEEILDSEGKSHSPKQYVQSHFVGDDTAKDKRILDQKWADIRSKRNRLLTESDWVVVKAKETHANASIPSDWVDYRTELRDITKQSDPDDITWPTKP